MQRVTVTLDDDLLAAIDSLATEKGYASRSEAVRDIVRNSIVGAAAKAGSEPCVAALSYVFDHETRDLAKRLTEVQHVNHHLSVASMHVHLDHDSCLEVSVLRGPAAEIEQVAHAVIAQRGVRYGHLHLIPDETGRHSERAAAVDGRRGGHAHR